jgi:hypothetical protein
LILRALATKKLLAVLSQIFPKQFHCSIWQFPSIKQKRGRARATNTNAAPNQNHLCWRRQLADRKGKSSRKRRTRRSTTFAQFKGKIIDRVEVNTTDYGCAIGIMFDDRTYLCFEVETGGLTILPDLSDWKTGNYKPLKRWRHISS